MKEVAGKLKIEYAQFLEKEIFTKFGMKLEEETLKLIQRGQRYREIFKQKPLHPRSLEEHILYLMLVDTGVLDEVPLEKVTEISSTLIKKLQESLPEITKNIKTLGRLSTKEREIIKKFFSNLFQELYAGQRD